MPKPLTMTLEQSKEWLRANGFKYDNIIMSFAGPHVYLYKHPDGRRASLDWEENGALTVDGVEIGAQQTTVNLFSSIIEHNT